MQCMLPVTRRVRVRDGRGGRADEGGQHPVESFFPEFLNKFSSYDLVSNEFHHGCLMRGVKYP